MMVVSCVHRACRRDGQHWRSQRRRVTHLRSTGCCNTMRWWTSKTWYWTEHSWIAILMLWFFMVTYYGRTEEHHWCMQLISVVYLSWRGCWNIKHRWICRTRWAVPLICRITTDGVIFFVGVSVEWTNRDDVRNRKRSQFYCWAIDPTYCGK